LVHPKELAMCRTVLALATLSLLTACGREQDVDAPSADEAVAVSPAPSRLPEVQVGQSELVRLQRAGTSPVRPVSSTRGMVVQPPQPAGVGVDVELEPAWSALSLTGVVGVPSCGWWIVASAQGTVSGGHASFAFDPKDEVDLAQQQPAFFFYVDHDGDGKCDQDKGDEVFTAQLGSMPAGSQASLALTDLQPSPYSCGLFEYLPSP
jgi:hypothetical protein